MKMKKGIFTLILFIAAVIFLSANVLIAEKLPGVDYDVPDTIVIDNKGYKKDKEEPYNFNHKQHYDKNGIACTECHHDYQDGKNVWKEGDPVKKCIECHDPIKTQGNAKKLETAYHNNCKDCHREKDPKAKEPEKYPWKKCTDCHER